MNTRHYWPTLTLGSALVALLALAHFVRDGPLQWGVVRIDNLAVFFAFTTLATLAFTATQSQATRRDWCIAALLLTAYSVTLTPMIAVLLAFVVLWSAIVGQTDKQTSRQADEEHEGLNDRWSSFVVRRSSFVVAAQRLLGIAAALVIATSLLVGYGALALGGALRYDDGTAGAALNSLVFWFVLLTVMLPVTPVAALYITRARRRSGARDQLVTLGLCYPLVRLYSLGPWNTGWGYATLLLGGAAALWSATAALTTSSASARLAHIRRGLAALALAGFGLGTGAGIAAGCYGMLALLVVTPAGQGDKETRKQGNKEIGVRSQESGEPVQRFIFTFSPFHLFTSSAALVFVAPFVAVWMLLGAALAGGAQALVGAAWLAALVGAVALLVGSRADFGRRNGAWSLALGVGAPLVVLWLIEPVIEQLQGGLTPYGDVVIWPWIGVAIKNSANTQIAVLPSLAVAALLVVLAALVYLVARVREPQVTIDEAVSAAPPRDPSRQVAFITLLRAEIPWLDLLLPSERNGAQHIDGE